MIIPVLAALAILLGFVLDGPHIWTIALVVIGLPVVLRTALGMVRGKFAADVIAMLAIVTAVALGQPLAGLIIVLMQTGGEALERYAEGRAATTVRELKKAAPSIAHRQRAGALEDIRPEEIVVGDTLLVRAGELIPSDGVVVDGTSHVDTSRLTGEPVPMRASSGTRVMSGSINGEGLLAIQATALARDSQYERIVELVRAAQASRAPLQRVADRYAVWFTPLTLVLCALTFALTRDWLRVLAVLVLATPCPLILATPVAIIGGINRAAKRKVILRTGAALERLGNIEIAIFDKTGTLTVGTPQIERIVASDGFDPGTILGLAAAVERGSNHLLARTVVKAAEQAGLTPTIASEVIESPGRGVEGRINGDYVIVGAWSLIEERAQHPPDRSLRPELDGRTDALHAFVCVNDRIAGMIEFADPLRPDLGVFFDDLKSLGVKRLVMLSGDKTENTLRVANEVGVKEAHGDLLPADKYAFVKNATLHGSVMMVGDGTNDAPALQAATVGIALASHGGGITAESADAVVLADDLTRITDAVRISRRTLRIAKQSIAVGLSLSALGMAFAAAGYISPTVGAVLQEVIDVAVIINALRASV